VYVVPTYDWILQDAVLISTVIRLYYTRDTDHRQSFESLKRDKGGPIAGNGWM